MKSKITLMFALLLCGCSSMAQLQYLKKNEFYQQLILQIGLGKNIPIFYKTSTVSLKRVKLSDNKLKWFGKEQVITMSKFLKQIEVDSLTDNELMPQVEGHPFVTAKYESINSRPQAFLEFSPIVYSKDSDLALCSVHYWTGPEAASETIYILGWQASRWKILKFLVVSIS